VETKFIRLRTPVTIGSRFGDWQVCWLGGWTRDRLVIWSWSFASPKPGNDNRVSHGDQCWPCDEPLLGAPSA